MITTRNPHWTESPPEFHVSVGILGTEERNPRQTNVHADRITCIGGLRALRERSHMTSAAEGGGGFEMLTVADKGGRGSKPC